MIPAETDSRFSLRKFGHVLTGIAPTVTSNYHLLIESIFPNIKWKTRFLCSFLSLNKAFLTIVIIESGRCGSDSFNDVPPSTIVKSALSKISGFFTK